MTSDNKQIKKPTKNLKQPVDSSLYNEDQIQRVVLLLEYLGKNYHGSQMQPEHATIQSELMAVLTQLNLPYWSLALSGRNDAGVNAYGQVAHFNLPQDCPATQDTNKLLTSLNALLPSDISIKRIKTNAPLTFHSRRSATHKWYRYRVLNTPQPSAWLPADAIWLKRPLNVAKMNEAAQYIKGCHNFKSFKCTDTAVIRDVCDIVYARVYQDGNFVIFDVVSDRFLYKMVRNLTGLLLDIGNDEKNLAPDTIIKVLNEQDRTVASATAKAKGLSMMAVAYPAPYNYFRDEALVQTLSTLVPKESNPTALQTPREKTACHNPLNTSGKHTNHK